MGESGKRMVASANEALSMVKAQAEIARLQDEVERLSVCVKDREVGMYDLMDDRDTAWNDAIEAAAQVANDYDHYELESTILALRRDKVQGVKREDADDFARLLRIDGIGQVLITIEDPEDDDDCDDDEVRVQFRIPDAGGLSGRVSILAQNEDFARSGMRAMTEDQIREMIQPMVNALAAAQKGEA